MNTIENTVGNKQRGFTLVEILVAISIIVVLVTVFAVSYGSLKNRARNAGTVGLIKNLEIALGLYHADFQDYPPDIEPKTGATGGGSLIYHLTRKLEKKTYSGPAYLPKAERERIVHVGPYLKEGLKLRYLSDEDYTPENDKDGKSLYTKWSTIEIIDEFGNPIHYDNCFNGGKKLKRGVATPQTDVGKWHPSKGNGWEPDEWPGSCLDPRASVQKAMNPGSFDLWSHGADPDSSDDDINNWE